MVKISRGINTNNFTNKFNVSTKFSDLFNKGNEIYKKTELEIDNIFKTSGCFTKYCSIEVKNRTTLILYDDKYKVKLSGFFLFRISEEKDNIVCVLNEQINNYKNIVKNLDEITKLGTNNKILKFGLETINNDGKIPMRYLFFDKLQNKNIDIDYVHKSIYHFVLPLIVLMKYKGYLKLNLNDGGLGYFIIEKYSKLKK